MKKLLCLFVAFFCLLSLMPVALAAGAGVSMADMQSVDSQNANYQESFTDTFGNTYSGAVCFDVTLGSYARYTLGGKFSRFVGTLTTSKDTNSNASFDIAIALDGKIVWSRQGFDKNTDPEKIDINLQGAQSMQVLTDTRATAFTFLYIADGIFYPTETSNLQPQPQMHTLKDAPLSDSGNYRYQVLTQDALGMLRGNNYLLGKRGSGYAVFNLDKNYETLTATVFAHKDSGAQIFRSCVIYCDGKEVARYEDISKQTSPIEITLDVANVTVLKIESEARTTSAWDNEGYLVLGDVYLQVHTHTPGALLEDLAPTCALPGRKSYTCTQCGKACAEEQIPVLPHTPGPWEVALEASCTEPGQQIKKCLDCGAVTQTEEIPLAAHVMSSWADVAGSVWNAPIYRERICATCQKTDQEVVYTFAWVKPLVLGVVLVLAAAAVLCWMAANKLCDAQVKKYGFTAVLKKACALRREDVETAASNLQGTLTYEQDP